LLIVKLNEYIYIQSSLEKQKINTMQNRAGFIELEFIFIINNTILIITTYFVSTFRGKFANFTFYL
jgi:hypothetical protein